MQEAKVSIIMGIYNCAETLGDAIDSILSQTYQNWELIMCDDGSCDNTYQIAVKYRDLYPDKIIVIKNEENLKLAATLNNCLKVASGKYIARMDGDDLSVPTRIEKQVKFLNDNCNYDLVGTAMQEFDETGYKRIVTNRMFPTKYDLPKGNPFCHATIMMKTEVLISLGGYRISKHTVRTEDVDLWYRFFSAGYLGANLSEPLYLVRVDKSAYKRRKLKFMFDSSYLIWTGCKMLKLPFYYRVYCFKPFLSWLLPRKIKERLRKHLIK